MKLFSGVFAGFLIFTHSAALAIPLEKGVFCDLDRDGVETRFKVTESQPEYVKSYPEWVVAKYDSTLNWFPLELKVYDTDGSLYTHTNRGDVFEVTLLASKMKLSCKKVTIMKNDGL